LIYRVSLWHPFWRYNMGKGKKKYWPLHIAIEEASKLGIEVSKPTLIKWIKKYTLGFQLGDEGGKWYVYPHKFMRYINGGKTETGEKPTIIVVQSDEEKSKIQE
jgi:hypothetical protein